jgi:DNA-binding transcriptional ArsR family regulator
MTELEQIAGSFRALSHPTRLLILGALRDGARLSPKELTTLLEGRPGLPLVAHHTRELARLGLLKRAGTRQVRGCVEHFYRISPYGQRMMGLVDEMDGAG